MEGFWLREGTGFIVRESMDGVGSGDGVGGGVVFVIVSKEWGGIGFRGGTGMKNK